MGGGAGLGGHSYKSPCLLLSAPGLLLFRIADVYSWLALCCGKMSCAMFSDVINLTEKCSLQLHMVSTCPWVEILFWGGHGVFRRWGLADRVGH